MGHIVYRWLTVPGEPATKAVVDDRQQTMFAVIAVVICIFTGLVVTALICIYWRYGRFLLVSKVTSGCGDVRAKKRVVVMHSNVLYHPGGSNSGSKDSDLALPFLPVVKIESGASRLTSQSTLVSEYEIPLDKDWEFPRDKWVIFVQNIFCMASR